MRATVTTIVKDLDPLKALPTEVALLKQSVTSFELLLRHIPGDVSVLKTSWDTLSAEVARLRDSLHDLRDVVSNHKLAVEVRFSQIEREHLSTRNVVDTNRT